MKVKIGESNLTVYWRYNNSTLSHNLTVGKFDASLLPLKKQLEEASKYGRFDKEDYPPDVTWCILANEKGEELGKISIRKHYKDSDNRDNARKYSLSKMLKCVFPDNKGVRRAFWEAYFDRLQPARTPMVVVK